MLIRWAKKTLPRPLVSRVKRIVRFGLPDLWDSLSGKRDPLVPPRSMMFVGLGEFRKIGNETFARLRDMGLVKPDSIILDVGSGIGRLARPLTEFLSPKGRYEGIDIDRSGVAWCQKHVTSRFPNFRFQLSDIYNKYYNPFGKLQSASYVFPFESNTFDFVLLNSVFTHMFPADVDQYLSEVARVLKPGGQSYITYFLWNQQAAGATAKGTAGYQFQFAFDGFRSMDEGAPEQGIALPEDYVLALYKKHGLSLPQPIYYGKWSGRENCIDFQDFIIGRK